PNAAQARAGFAAEEAAGTPRDASTRNYRDPNHKPELLCALTEFDALCGFRPVRQTAQLIDMLDVGALTPYRQLLLGPDGLRAAFTALLQLDASDRAVLVAQVVDACRRLAIAPAV